MNVTLSIVIAVYNGADFLKKCLPAIYEAADVETEVILVDDGSNDDSGKIGKNFGVDLITLKQRGGSARARNIGVRQARGEIILFVDADVIIKPQTVLQLRRIFADNPEISAVFGSYDDAPGEPDFFSQYRNLMHHFFHQTGNREAETFWSGFGAIKREVFLEVKGFDAEKYEIPSIEDIELGYRLRAKGHRILLVPQLQAKHLKKWTFRSILKTDFWQRAVPWTEIILQNPQNKLALNAENSQKFSALLVVCFVLSLMLIIWRQWFAIAAILSLLIFLAINREFYKFFLRSRGVLFTLRVFPMHLLYFFYSSAAFLLSWFNVRIRKRKLTVR